MKERKQDRQIDKKEWMKKRERKKLEMKKDIQTRNESFQKQYADQGTVLI